MAFRKRPEYFVPPDPDQVMRGVCGTCKAEIRTTRSRASVGRGWGDVPTTACPACGAAVSLLPAVVTK